MTFLPEMISVISQATSPHSYFNDMITTTPHCLPTNEGYCYSRTVSVSLQVHHRKDIFLPIWLPHWPLQGSHRMPNTQPLTCLNDVHPFPNWAFPKVLAISCGCDAWNGPWCSKITPPPNHSTTLLKLDKNQALRLIYALQLSHLAKDKDLFSDMQYGSRAGCMCSTPVINKIISYDLLRQTKMPGTTLDINALSCFDHIIQSLALLIVTTWHVEISYAHAQNNMKVNYTWY